MILYELLNSVRWFIICCFGFITHAQISPQCPQHQNPLPLHLHILPLINFPFNFLYFLQVNISWPYSNDLDTNQIVSIMKVWSVLLYALRDLIFLLLGSRIGLALGFRIRRNLCLFSSCTLCRRFIRDLLFLSSCRSICTNIRYLGRSIIMRFDVLKKCTEGNLWLLILLIMKRVSWIRWNHHGLNHMMRIFSRDLKI